MGEGTQTEGAIGYYPCVDYVKPVIGLYSEGFGAGKDSSAAALIAHEGYIHHDFSMALKRHLWANLLKVRFRTFERWYDYCEAHKYDTPDQDGYWVRTLLQGYGQFFRSIDPDYWVKLVDLAPVGTSPKVVPSVRYPNEAQAIKDAGGLIWKVERPGIAASDDPSETSMRGWMPDAVIHNDGTIPQLHRAALDLYHAGGRGQVCASSGIITLWPRIPFNDTRPHCCLKGTSI